ncbi:MAG: hypothetical protein JST31_07695 [Actinobacteria bacterium]|nr:hypothetical protein [Actinomycetota bacterium]
MRSLVLAIAVALLLTTAATASATEVSYVDQGQVWVSTLDGAQKRPISGPAPVVTAGESRAWTEQAQSDDGWIVGVARVSGRTGAAAPTRLWSPSGAVAAESTLGYHGAYNNGSLAVPVQLDLAPGGQQMIYTYSDLVYGFPTSTLYQGTWVTNTASSSGEPFDIPDLVGTSLAGSRWVGINANAGSADPNVYVESAGGNGPFSYSGDAWFHATGAWSVDAAANGSAIAVVYRLGGAPYALGLFAGSGIGTPLTGASCDMPTVGNVDGVSLSQDGRWIAWTDDRGLLVAPLPPLGSGSPCPMSAAPVVISATGSYPSLGPTTLATPPAAPAAAAPPGSPKKKTPGSSSSAVTVAKTVKASAFATGLKLVVTVRGKGTVSAVAKVGGTTLARASAKAKRAGRVALTLKAPKGLLKRLSSFRGKTLKLTVKGPGVSSTLKRRLK